VDPKGGDDPNLIRGVGYGGDRFIGVGNQIWVTRDGATWEKKADTQSFLSDVAYDGSIFAAAGGNGLRMRSTDGGETWTDATPYFAGHYRSIAWGNGRFVAVGHTYGDAGEQGLASFSSDGKAWSKEQVVDGTRFISVAFGNGVFVAVGEKRCATSSNGETWTPCNVATNGLSHISFIGNQFVVSDMTGRLRSADGASWQHTDGPGPEAWAYGLGVYVGFGWQDVQSSPDLVNWTKAPISGPGLAQVAFGYLTQAKTSP
jgi:hypothetical protein